MGKDSDELKQRIEAERSRLGQNLNELEYRVKSATDWRTHFNERPGLLLGAAFGLGFLLAMFKGERSVSRPA
jgi:hypothetical protein